MAPESHPSSLHPARFDTLIIGAGMAGLSVAFHLLVENDYGGSVAICEARDRIGGRIVGTDLAGRRVELGANWIHGLVGNPVYKLAERFGLIDPLAMNAESGHYGNPNVCGHTSPDGRPVPLATVAHAYDVYFRMVKQCEMLHDRPNASSNVVDGEKSVGQRLRRLIDEHLAGRTATERPLWTAMFEQMLQRECCINGCADMEQVSLSSYGAYEELPGGNLVMPGGYTQLIEHMLTAIRRKLTGQSQAKRFQLLLNHEVQQIQWIGLAGQDKPGLQIDRDTEYPVRLICHGGQTLLAKHLVNTMPIGVLKHRLLTTGSSLSSPPHADPPLYSPPLPDYKLRVIQSIGIDVVNKIYLEYDQSLCPHHWDPMVDELFCINLNSPAPDSKDYKVDQHWTRRIYSFARLNNRLLLGWVFGKEARHVEQLARQDKGQQLQRQLTDFLRSLTGRRDFPDPKRVLVTQWGSDPYSLGSYSFIGVNGSRSNFEELAEPIFADPAQDKVSDWINRLFSLFT